MNQQLMRTVLIGAVIVGAAALTWLARADGGFFTAKGVANLAATADQVAVIVRTGDTVSITLSAGYTGGGDDFAWVIPVPAVIGAADVTEVTDGPIDALDLLSAPLIHNFYRDSAGGNCGCGGDSSDGWDDKKSFLTAAPDRFTTATYDINVLAVPDLAALTGWLDANNYAVSPAGEAVLGAYITANPSYFVAIRLQPAAIRDYSNEFLPPVCIMYRSADLAFPIHVSQLSAQAVSRVKLMVVAPSTVSSPNFITRDLFYSQQPGAVNNLQAYFTQRILATLAGTPRGFARNYAKPFTGFDALAEISGRAPLPGESYFLTRLETFVEPAAMTEDAVLALESPVRSFRVDIYQYHNRYSSGVGGPVMSAAFVLAVPGAAFAALRRRARRGRLNGPRAGDTIG